MKTHILYERSHRKLSRNYFCSPIVLENPKELTGQCQDMRRALGTGNSSDMNTWQWPYWPNYLSANVFYFEIRFLPGHVITFNLKHLFLEL